MEKIHVYLLCFQCSAAHPQVGDRNWCSRETGNARLIKPDQ